MRTRTLNTFVYFIGTAKVTISLFNCFVCLFTNIEKRMAERIFSKFVVIGGGIAGVSCCEQVAFPKYLILNLFILCILIVMYQYNARLAHYEFDTCFLFPLTLLFTSINLLSCLSVSYLFLFIV